MANVPWRQSLFGEMQEPRYKPNAERGPDLHPYHSAVWAPAAPVADAAASQERDVWAAKRQRHKSARVEGKGAPIQASFPSNSTLQSQSWDAYDRGHMTVAGRRATHTLTTTTTSVPSVPMRWASSGDAPSHRRNPVAPTTTFSSSGCEFGPGVGSKSSVAALEFNVLCGSSPVS